MYFRFKNLAFRPLTAETRAHIPGSERLWPYPPFQRIRFHALSESSNERQLLDLYRNWPSTSKTPGSPVPPGRPHPGELPLYMLIMLLHEESRLTSLQIKLVSDRKLCRIQRKTYRPTAAIQNLHLMGPLRERREVCRTTVASVFTFIWSSRWVMQNTQASDLVVLGQLKQNGSFRSHKSIKVMINSSTVGVLYM